MWLLVLYDKIVYVALLFIAYVKTRTKYKAKGWYLFAISFIGFFLIYVLIETATRYRYSTMLFIVLLAGGADKINEYFVNRT